MGKYFRNKMFIAFLISIFIIAILFFVNLNKITEESTTEELITYLKQDIGNVSKVRQVNKAINILNNRDVSNKMQIYFDIITLNDYSVNKADYKNINKLIQLTLNKNNYNSNEEEYIIMINKYSDTYFFTQDELLKTSIITRFNEIDEIFYPNNEDTFMENMFGLDIDFSEEEEYMASKFLDGIISRSDTSIDQIVIDSLFTKIYSNSNLNEQIDYHRFYSVLKKHYENKFGKGNSVENVIQINNERVDYFNQLKWIADDIDRLKSNSGFKRTEGASDYIQKEYEKAINDPSIMAKAIDIFESEKKAKSMIMKTAILSAQVNGYYESINNDKEIENKTIEFNNIMKALELLNDQLFKEIDNIFVLMEFDLAEKTPEVKIIEEKKNEENSQYELPLTKTVTATVEIYTNEHELELFKSKLGYYIYYQDYNLSINEFKDHDEYSMGYSNGFTGFSINLMDGSVGDVQNWVLMNIPKNFSNVSNPKFVESPVRGVLIEAFDNDGDWEARHYIVEGNGKVFYIEVMINQGMEGLPDIFDMYLKEFVIM